jgi:hypothetical protein
MHQSVSMKSLWFKRPPKSSVESLTGQDFNEWDTLASFIAEDDDKLILMIERKYGN